MTASMLALAVLVAVAYGVQTVSGFGAGLILVTLGVHLVELPTLLALILPLSIAQTGWITLRHWRAVDGRLLLGKVIPVMGAGVGLGYLVAAQVSGMTVVKQVLGVFVVLLAARELWQLHRGTTPAVGTPIASTLSIFGAGVVHGIYATGGPLLVYGLGREGLDRARFRATVTTVWLVLNVGLVATYAVEGRYTPHRLGQLLVLLVGIPVGVAAGERVFSRVSERAFRWGIYGLLAVAGVPLILS